MFDLAQGKKENGIIEKGGLYLLTPRGTSKV
jgi:hypothetical protein